MRDIPQGKGSCQNFSKACEAEGVWRIQGLTVVANIYCVHYCTLSQYFSEQPQTFLCITILSVINISHGNIK